MHIQLLANVGIPMLFGEWWPMTLALLPVIAIETFVVRGSVQLPLGRALGGVAAANAVSTLIGVPRSHGSWHLLSSSLPCYRLVLVPSDGTGNWTHLWLR